MAAAWNLRVLDETALTALSMLETWTSFPGFDLFAWLNLLANDLAQAILMF